MDIGYPYRNDLPLTPRRPRPSERHVVIVRELAVLVSHVDQCEDLLVAHKSALEHRGPAIPSHPLVVVRHVAAKQRRAPRRTRKPQRTA